MKQVYFDMKYADLKLRIANAQKAEETARKHSEVKEAHRQYKLSEKTTERVIRSYRKKYRSNGIRRSRGNFQ